MKVEYYNLYITKDRLPLIQENSRERIEKYITGIINNTHSKLYSIYANPEHLHFLASRSPHLSEETLVSIIAAALSRSSKLILLQSVIEVT